MKDKKLEVPVSELIRIEAISGGLETILKALIDLSRIWIARIKDDYARNTLTDLANSFKGVVGALADEDPNDSEQIKKILSEFLADSGFVDRTKDELQKKIDALADPVLKVVLSGLLPVAFDIIKQLFDENKANEEQIVETLKLLLRSNDGSKIVTAVFMLFIKEEATARMIASLFLSVLDGLIKLQAAMNEGK